MPATAAVDAELSEPRAFVTFFADFLCFELFCEVTPLPEVWRPFGATPAAKIYLSISSW